MDTNPTIDATLRPNPVVLRILETSLRDFLFSCGLKYSQNGVQNWITFSFLLLGLCLGPVLWSRFGPKSGASHRKILLLPADVLQADLRRTSMSVSVNACFFSLCVPICFLYSRFESASAAKSKFERRKNDLVVKRLTWASKHLSKVLLMRTRAQMLEILSPKYCRGFAKAF